MAHNIPVGGQNSFMFDGSAIVEDGRFFEKEHRVFRKVWGKSPKDGVSVNALTESDTNVKYDPLGNGISLDLVNERVGGASSKESFGENSLFKLKTFQSPILLSNAVITDPLYVAMSDQSYNELKARHKSHEECNYELYIYEDERHEMLTFPNFHGSKYPDGCAFEHRRFETDANATPWWQRYFDEKILFQVSPNSLHAKKPYDTTMDYDSHPIHQSSMNSPTTRLANSAANNTDKNATLFKKDMLTHKHSMVIYPCKIGVSNQYEVIPKIDFEISFEIKLLNDGKMEVFTVVDVAKLFDDTTVTWCADFGTLTKKNTTTPTDLKPFYKFRYSEADNMISSKNVVSKSDLMTMCIRRFYTRFDHGRPNISGPNKDFYKKLRNAGQFTPAFFDDVKKEMQVAKLRYKQFSNGVLNTDSFETVSTGVSITPPQIRSNRFLSAHNPNTNELVCQFLPVLEDRSKLVELFAGGTPKSSQAPLNYQQWFWDKCMQLNNFCDHEIGPARGQKRRIFSVYLENDELRPGKKSNILNWTKDDCPLIYLHIKYSGSRNKARQLSGISCQLHNNLEGLGFNLYGNMEILYGWERFYSEWLTYKDELLHLKTLYKDDAHLVGSIMGARVKGLGGEWYKSLLTSATTAEKAFAKKWSEFYYRAVNIYDDEELKAKVRTDFLRNKIRKEAIGHMKRLDDWIKINNIDPTFKTDAFSHRGQLVFRPVSTTDDKYTVDWTERSAEFGLDQLTKPQKDALKVYVTDTKKLFAIPNPFVPQDMTFLGSYINYKNTGPLSHGMSGFKRGSYCLSLMGGNEYDIVSYSNFIVEPDEQLKTLLLGSSNSDKPYFAQENTNNHDPIARESSFKNHPLYNKSDGTYIGNDKYGSFWQFPVARSTDARSFTSKRLTEDSDFTDFKTRHNGYIKNRVNTAANQGFYTPMEMKDLQSKKYSRGRRPVNSSIRVELPDFLHDNYSYQEINYQQHAIFTIDTSDITNWSQDERRLERKRMQYFDVSKSTLPQPIKKKRSEDISIHFFLRDGLRPLQDNIGALTDAKSQNTFYAPFHNVEVTIYKPKLDPDWFKKLNQPNFLKNEIIEQFAKSVRNNTRLDFDNIDAMATISNLLSASKRLSQSVGDNTTATMSGIVNETIDTNGAFFKRIKDIWDNVQAANKEFKQKYWLMTQPVRNKIIPPLLENFLLVSPSKLGNVFEYMFQIESVSIPMNINNLLNDETIYILTDFFMEPNQVTNVDGAFDKKIIGKIELSSIKNRAEKARLGHSLTFSSVRGGGVSASHENSLFTNSITLKNLNDIKRYSFSFVNSNFDPITFNQINDSTKPGKFVKEAITVMVEFYIVNNIRH